jgi:hypothetical protein
MFGISRSQIHTQSVLVLGPGVGLGANVDAGLCLKGQLVGVSFWSFVLVLILVQLIGLSSQLTCV